MALEGTLKDFSLADIFQLIGLQRKTGVLTLRAKEDVVTISFLDGKVVGADSLNKRLEDRLGQVLLKGNVISREALERALALQKETLERLGHILLTHGIIERDELAKALEKQILQIIYRTFRWQDGDYQFAQETSVDYDHELVQPLSTESILMEGARMLDEWPIIEKKISDPNAVFVPTKAAENLEIAPEEDLEEVINFQFEQAPFPEAGAPASTPIRVTLVEHHVLRLLNGRHTVTDVICSSMYGEFDTCKALYTLLNRGLIRRASRTELVQAAAVAVGEETAPEVAKVGFPSLLFLFLPLLAASVYLWPKNPVNFLLGPGQSPKPKFFELASYARLWGLGEILLGTASWTGAYPNILSEISKNGFAPAAAFRDPWGQPYRYVLKESSLLLAGDGPNRTPNPTLLIVMTLPSGPESTVGVKGVELIEP